MKDRDRMYCSRGATNKRSKISKIHNDTTVRMLLAKMAKTRQASKQASKQQKSTDHRAACCVPTGVIYYTHTTTPRSSSS